jgi:hypothetical protein
MSSSDARLYLVWFAAAAAVGFAAFLALHVGIDPYGQMPRTAWLCGDGIKDPRGAKRLIAPVRRPEEVLIGNSRVAAGFARRDVEALTGRRAANLALDNASLEEVEMLARHALAEAPVRRLWIGLDFAMFVDPASGVSEQRTPWLRGLLDPRAMAATVLVLRERERCRAAIDRDGFMIAPVPPRDADGDARTFKARDPSPFLGRRVQPGRSMSLVRLLDEAGALRVDTVVFLAPVHPAFRDELKRAGLEAAERQWRRDIARAVAGRARFVDMEAVELPAACAASSAAACPFSDPLHYRPSVGRRLIEAGLAAR